MEPTSPDGRGGCCDAAALPRPCVDCATPACCHCALLYHFEVEDLPALDRARHALQFPGVELGLDAEGGWTVYYRMPCRGLDREPGLCRLHGTAERPRLCLDYDPYDCWYRHTWMKGASDRFFRIDAGRFAYLLPLIGFDNAQRIVRVPSWEQMLAEMPPIAAPGVTWEPDEVPEDPTYDRWAAAVRAGADAAEDPLDDGAAAACRVLSFSHGRPRDCAQLDYLGFLLCYPGLELSVTDQDWSVVLRSRCRNLSEGERCALLGGEERPLLCRSDHAPRPERGLRLRRETLAVATAAVRFDAAGRVVHLPSQTDMRAAIETHWRGTPL